MKKILSISEGSSSRNHVTEQDFLGQVCHLEHRGLHVLVTFTPRLEGRSFGTDVMEATMLALMDRPQSQVIERIPIKPTLEA
jgi:hypothetical protein